MFPPEKPNLILIPLIEPADPTPLMQSPPPPDPLPGLVPPRADVPPEPEGLWDDIAVEYGVVFEALHDDVRGGGGEEERESRPDLEGERQKRLPSDRFEGKEQEGEDGRRQVPLVSIQKTSEGEVNAEEDGAFPGLYLNQCPQTGVLRIRLDLQMKFDEGAREEMDRKVRVEAEGKRDAGVVEGSERERIPLHPAYASQNSDILSSRADQSDFLPDDYGVLRLATPNEVEKDDNDDDDEQEEEERPIIINWDPMTRKLVLPELDMEFTKEAQIGGVKQAEGGRESRLGGEEEEGKLTLESVFVRQASEEEAQRELETDGDPADVLAKWDLVISMSQ